MTERVLANGTACVTCAARTRSPEGFMCQPWKLGPSNKIGRKNHRFVLGRTHTSGTTIRPANCPHPKYDGASTEGLSVQTELRKILSR